MKPHPRPPALRCAVRRTIKWGGLALCLLIAGVWVRSECAPAMYVTSTCVCEWDLGAIRLLPGPQVNRFRGYLPLVRMGTPLPRAWCWFYRAAPNWLVIVPLWLPLAPTLLATAAAWRLDALARRRARAGLCPKCHYDRAGIAADAKCPECGHTPAR
jgi:hypothetical protein